MTHIPGFAHFVGKLLFIELNQVRVTGELMRLKIRRRERFIPVAPDLWRFDSGLPIDLAGFERLFLETIAPANAPSVPEFSEQEAAEVEEELVEEDYCPTPEIPLDSDDLPDLPIDFADQDVEMKADEPLEVQVPGKFFFPFISLRVLLTFFYSRW